MSTNVGSIHYDLGLDTSKFQAEANQLGSSISSFGKKLAIGTAVAGAAVTAFGVSAVKSFQDSELAAAQLSAVLKSTGGVAGVTADMANDLASSLQKVTRYSDEAILGAENMLLTFTNIGKDIFPDTTKAVLDMSTAMGTDLQTTAIQVGKALQDPVQGVTALQRVGVRLTDSQKDLVEQLVKTGRSAEAQKIILKELQTEFGGSAEAAGKTFAGKLDILRNQFDDVKESIGKVIVDALLPLGDKLTKFVASDQFQAWLKQLQAWLAYHLPLAINWLTTQGIPFLINVFNAVWPVVKILFELFKGLVGFLNDNTWVLYAFAAAFLVIRTAMFLHGALQAFQTVMAGVRASFIVTRALILSPIAMPAILVAAAIASLWSVYQAVMSVRDAIAAVNGAARAAQGLAPSAKMQELQRQATAARARGDTKEVNRIANALKALGGNAKGTHDWRGGLTWVGEKGPEIVNLPKHSQVIPNDRLDKVGSQGTTVTNETIINGNIMLGDVSAVDAFFAKLNRNNELARKGLATT